MTVTAAAWVCVSSILGGQGIEQVLHPLLTDAEVEALRHAACLFEEHICEAGV